ncbi:GNAT family N-acetyltransferase [Halomonas sp. HP20-15]|uniref:GNAT family N-acetyltransferase n=1 Tax=Halomonas sp. HP20-15 TaxID=3085901 RepID=UPI002980D1BC|nr:GNAT family N-acetyltransferase [Halomonas sp. HP20-15]MDW5377587.1 GNAT family N-acetyltransferase [Halomonas sp. HP20-15]
MQQRIRYRAALGRDAADQAEVFHHAVMQGAAGRYTLAQREAWVSALPREASAWLARQALYATLVAECDGHCVGFVELDTSEGRIETLYVWPSLGRRGIATQLLELAEQRLHEQGMTRLRIEASLVLADALERRGWQRVGDEWVERQGESLPRVGLVKALGGIPLGGTPLGEGAPRGIPLDEGSPREASRGKTPHDE